MAPCSRVEEIAERSLLVRQALATARELHEGAVRDVGDEVPFISHPLAVAELLAEYGMDEELIAAGLLHDMLEYTPLRLGALRERFGMKVALIVCALMLRSGWRLLRDSGRVLLEGSPKDIDVEAVGRALAGAPGVAEVHDLHVWEVTSGFPALAAHVLVSEGDDCHARRGELERLLDTQFGIEHTTLQVDHVHPERLLEITPAHGPQSPPAR